MKEKVSIVTYNRMSEETPETIENKEEIPKKEPEELPVKKPAFHKKISEKTARYHSNVCRARNDPSFTLHDRKSQPKTFFTEQLQFATSIHEVILVNNLAKIQTESEQLQSTFILYNYQDRLSLYQPISKKQRFTEQPQIRAIDIYPKKQLTSKSEILVGYLTGSVEILRINNFEPVQSWKRSDLGEVACLSWLRNRQHIYSNTQRLNQQFFVSYTNLPGILLLYDRNVRSESTHEYMKNREVFNDLASHRTKFITQSSNPAQIWDISPFLIICVAWSKDTIHLAVGDESGTIMVFDFGKREKKVQFQSFFGGVTSLDWSWDNLYLVSGGQDDLVAVWDVTNQHPLCIGEGHTSWITDIKFEKRKNETAPYRFISTSRDTRIIFWTFLPIEFETKKEKGPKILSHLDIKHVPKIDNKNVNEVLKQPVAAILRTNNFLFTSDNTCTNVWRLTTDTLVEETMKALVERNRAQIEKNRQENSKRRGWYS